MQYQVVVTEAAHNVVLLHLVRCTRVRLTFHKVKIARQNFELFTHAGKCWRL